MRCCIGSQLLARGDSILRKQRWSAEECSQNPSEAAPRSLPEWVWHNSVNNRTESKSTCDCSQYLRNATGKVQLPVYGTLWGTSPGKQATGGSKWPLEKSRFAVFHSSDLYHGRVKTQVLMRLMWHPLLRSFGQASMSVSFPVVAETTFWCTQRQARNEVVSVVGSRALNEQSAGGERDGTLACKLLTLQLSINSLLLPGMSSPVGSQDSPRTSWNCSYLHHDSLEPVLRSLHSLFVSILLGRPFHSGRMSIIRLTI